jgi:hypothetical protein
MVFVGEGYILTCLIAAKVGISPEAPAMAEMTVSTSSMAAKRINPQCR